eukprot:TRINITY_DN1494_c0_g1_i2.p1 TRINITY_DN1494_c0_g1~~TRINITY_DN1494_c0_g1_i2.p1  ORF type:complete len:225 (-),score=8.18 TRINITY_DN1494_c0_g1_i2:986-1660(-)
MPITKFRFQNLSEQQKQEITITEFIRIIKVRNRPINTDEFCRKTMVPSIYKEYSISYLKAKTMEATQSLELLKEGNGALNRDALNYIKDNISASQLCVISNGGKVGLGKSTFENALIYSLLHQSKQEGHRQKGNSYFKATESATSVTKGVNIQKEILDNPKGGKVLLMDILFSVIQTVGKQQQRKKSSVEKSCQIIQSQLEMLISKHFFTIVQYFLCLRFRRSF